MNSMLAYLQCIYQVSLVGDKVNLQMRWACPFIN